MLSGVTYAAKGYFDALVKMGELASESQGSKELGESCGILLKVRSVWDGI